MTSCKGFGFQSIIYSAFSILLLLCYFLPQVKMFVGYIPLTIMTVVFCMIYIAPLLGKRNLIYGTLSYAVLFCLMMFLFGMPFNIKFGFFHPLIIVWLTIFPALLSFNTIIRNNYWEKRVICYLGILLFFLVIRSTLHFIHEDPNIVRSMTGILDDDIKEEMRMAGVGGYGIAYACGAFSIFLFGMLMSVKKGFVVRIVLLGAFLYTLYFVLNAQFATLLLITLISLGAVSFYLTKSNVIRFLMICMMPLFLVLLPEIITYLIEIYQDQTIASRLSSLLSALQGNSDLENFSGYRSQYQMAALRLFGQSPLWGSDISTGLARHIFIASHSTMLAFLAATGLIGTFFYYKSLWNASRIVYINLSPRMKNTILKPLLLYFILLTILNPTSETLELYFIIFATIPLLINIFHLYNNPHETK